TKPARAVRRRSSQANGDQTGEEGNHHAVPEGAAKLVVAPPDTGVVLPPGLLRKEAGWPGEDLVEALEAGPQHHHHRQQHGSEDQERSDLTAYPDKDAASHQTSPPFLRKRQ